jgi:hypothetical protein
MRNHDDDDDVAAAVADDDANQPMKLKHWVHILPHED